MYLNPVNIVAQDSLDTSKLGLRLFCEYAVFNPPPQSGEGIIGMQSVRNILCPCYYLHMH